MFATDFYWPLGLFLLANFSSTYESYLPNVLYLAIFLYPGYRDVYTVDS